MQNSKIFFKHILQTQHYSNTKSRCGHNKKEKTTALNIYVKNSKLKLNPTTPSEVILFNQIRLNSGIQRQFDIHKSTNTVY